MTTPRTAAPLAPRPRRRWRALRAANVAVCAVGAIFHLIGVARVQSERDWERLRTASLRREAITLGQRRIVALAFSPDGRALYALGDRLPPGSSDRRAAEVIAWDTRSGRVRWRVDLPGDARPGALAVSPGGDAIAAGGATALRVLDAYDGHALRSSDAVGASSVSFSPDGRTLALVTGRAVRLLPAHAAAAPLAGRVLSADRPVVWARYAPGGALLVAEAADTRDAPLVRVVARDPRNGRVLRVFGGPDAPPALVALSDDGALLARTDPGTARSVIHRVSDGAVLLEGVPGLRPSGRVARIAFRRGLSAGDEIALHLDGIGGDRAQWRWKSDERGGFTVTGSGLHHAQNATAAATAVARRRLAEDHLSVVASPDERCHITLDYLGDMDVVRSVQIARSVADQTGAYAVDSLDEWRTPEPTPTPTFAPPVLD